MKLCRMSCYDCCCNFFFSFETEEGNTVLEKSEDVVLGMFSGKDNAWKVRESCSGNLLS